MNPERRCSPDVRMTRSGSGWSFVYRWEAMSWSVKDSATSARLRPAAAASRIIARTASVISWRPPYPTAILTFIPSVPAVASMERERSAATPSGSSERSPTIASRHAPCFARASTASQMIRSSSPSSSASRERLSVDSSHRVTMLTPASFAHPRNSLIFPAPARCPCEAGAPRDFAHRRFPSRMTPMCAGIGAVASSARRRRS